MPSTTGQEMLLDEIRAARSHGGAPPSLTPAAYARHHADFEQRSDQRLLITAHLDRRLRLRTGPISVLSVGCGEGAVDIPLARMLTDADPGRPVRYVGVEPFEGSGTRFLRGMAELDRPSLSVELHATAFAEATVVGPFDVITFVHSMYYVPDVVQTVRSARGLLAPRGELFVYNAPRGVLSTLVALLGPSVDGHPQWFSEDLAEGFGAADFEDVVTETIGAVIDLTDATDGVLDFTVQAVLDDRMRPLVRAYLAAVALPGSRTRLPHPVDVHRCTVSPAAPGTGR